MLLISAPQTGPRLRYVLEALFSHLTKIPWRLLPEDAETASPTTGLLISYGYEPRPEALLHIPAEGLLFETGIRKERPRPVLSNDPELPLLFPIQPQSPRSLSFDLFSAAFYMLSRYEEYLPFEGDAHGRFRLRDSIFADSKPAGIYPRKPLVDLWLEHFLERLQQEAQKQASGTALPDFRQARPAFRFRPSYDLDLPWMLVHKRPLQALGGALRDLLRQGPGSLLRRYRIWRKPENDPAFTFPFLEKLHEKYGLQALYFAPTGPYGRYDKAPSHRHPAYRRLLRKLDRRGEVGLHPSYHSSEKPELLLREKQRLEKILNRPLTASRQHFLRFRFPQTPRALTAAGITRDYSLGFAEAPGFRSGTCHAYPWYDLEKEEKTELMLHPLPLMDVSLFQYLKLPPKKAASLSNSLMEETRKYGGEFVSLWHNNTLASAGKREFYEQWVVRPARGSSFVGSPIL